MNPRYCCQYNGFRIRPVRPLRHLSNGAHHTNLFAGSEAPNAKKFACYQTLARQLGLQRHAEALGHFFVGFDDVAEALAEAVLVHLLAGFLVPQAAAVGAEFVA